MRYPTRSLDVPDLTLADLKPGMRALIERVDAHQPGVVRLMVLGLVEGSQVELRNTAIGGDPLEIGLHGASVSVRREQALAFHVSSVTARVD